MTGRAPRLLLLLTAALATSACDKLPFGPHGPAFDKPGLEAALDPSVGGPDTCVVVDDVASGAEVYRYGAPSACNRPLAPCDTFDIPLGLIAVDDGKVAPGQTLRWDGRPQRFKAWERDADLKTAFAAGTGWFFQRLALQIGAPRLRQQLSAFGYGQGAPIGAPDAFWQGPAAGGGLFISTRGQARFLRRLARGDLPVKPEAASAVERLMLDETRGATTLAGQAGSCPSIADASRRVGWWIGRIKGPGRDLTFAVSIESEAGDALPGLEIAHRVKPIFTRFGLLPAA